MLSTTTLIWLLLFVFACNDGEEILTAGAWVHNNRDKYAKVPGALSLNPEKPLTAQFSVAVAVMGSGVLTAALLGASTFAQTGRLHGFFVAAVALMFVDGVKHILMAISLRGYSSGVVSAALVQVPYGAYAIHRFLTDGLVTWSDVIRNGLLGIPVVAALLLLGFALARRVVPYQSAARSAG